MSLAAVGYIFLVILVCAAFSEEYLMILTLFYQWNVGRLYLDPDKRRKGLRLFHQPMDLLMVSSYTLIDSEIWPSWQQLSLFFADTLQAIGGALNTRWISEGKVELGTFCDAQGRSEVLCRGWLVVTLFAIYRYHPKCRGDRRSALKSRKKVHFSELSQYWLILSLDN